MADLRPSWMGLVFIFQRYTWLLFFTIIIGIGCTWFILGCWLPEHRAHKALALCLLNGWAVFLGQSAHNRPHTTALRILFVMIALYGLNVTTIYTSNLIRVFTNPAYQNQIDTIEEIIESGLPFGRICSFFFSITVGRANKSMLGLQVDAKTITTGSRMTIRAIKYYLTNTNRRMSLFQAKRICTVCRRAKKCYC